jgi:hypothetical protein
VWSADPGESGEFCDGDGLFALTNPGASHGRIFHPALDCGHNALLVRVTARSFWHAQDYLKKNPNLALDGLSPLGTLTAFGEQLFINHGGFMALSEADLRKRKSYLTASDVSSV